MEMRGKKLSRNITDKEFSKLVASKNVAKAVMVKGNQVYKYGYEK